MRMGVTQLNDPHLTCEEKGSGSFDFVFEAIAELDQKIFGSVSRSISSRRN